MATLRRTLISTRSLLRLPLSRISPSPLLRCLATVSADQIPCLPPPPATRPRYFSTRTTTSSLNDPSPNWTNRPPKETILLDGCDFEHWLVVMDPPDENTTRDEIIDDYIKTLAKVVGSEEEARMKIYSVSTKHYFAFGALVSEELSYKIKELPKVRWVLPDSYLDVKNKDYGGEPFINGQAVPYDPKYHEEWVRNNARANERSRRNDRPRNFDRSRNFERRRENMQNQYRDGPPMQNQGFQNHPNAGGPHPPNQGFQNQPNTGFTPPPNQGFQNQPNTGFTPPPNQGFQNQPNMGFTPPQNNRFQGQLNTGFAPPPHNQDQGLPDMGNMGNMPPPNQGFQHYPNRDVHPPNADFTNRGFQNRGMPNRDYQNSNYRPNQEMEGMPGGNSHQTRDMPGRDAPPMPNQD